MAKFICEICGNEVITPEAVCCDQYMKAIKENKGFGGIIKKPNGTVSGKF